MVNFFLLRKPLLVNFIWLLKCKLQKCLYSFLVNSYCFIIVNNFQNLSKLFLILFLC
jgi:hypothetical protein